LSWSIVELAEPEVDVGAAADHQRLGERGAVDGADRVGDDLDRLALADLAGVDDLLAHRLEQRPGALHVLVAAAAHDRERAVLGLGSRAGHGGVDEAVALVREGAADAAGVLGRDRRAVDEQRLLGRAVGGAVLAEQHLLHLGAVDHHRDHGVGAVGGLSGRAGDGGAVLLRP
jgi:hypothetical protein